MVINFSCLLLTSDCFLFTDVLSVYEFLGFCCVLGFGLWLGS